MYVIMHAKFLQSKILDSKYNILEISENFN